MPLNPVVDVVIPVYNRTDIFFECLKSVLSQEYNNLNIFVIEDGSLLLNPYKEYFNTLKNVQFVSLKENHGPSYCRNYGASLGCGSYIVFIDSDDLWESGKIKAQIKFMQNNPDVNWVHTNELWYKNNTLISQKKEHRKQGGIFFDRLLDRCLISPSSVMFKRDFFMDSGGFLSHFRMAEDYELWLRLNLHHEIGYIEEPLTIKRAGDWDQLSRTPEIDKYRVLALHRIYRIYHNTPEFQIYKDTWKKIILKKIEILVKGAQKYNKTQALKKYQNWSKLFNTF
jgi:glycosyltransferase involved in cell wall biosynthesis